MAWARSLPRVIANRLSGFGTTIFTEMRRSPGAPARSTSARASPTRTGRPSVLEAAAAGHARRPQPVRAAGRRARAARGDRRAPARRYGLARRPRGRRPGHVRRDRGDRRRAARRCSTPATRWSCSSRCTTRTRPCIALRRRRRRRVVTLRPPDCAFDPDQLRAAVIAAHALAAAQHAAQPDRQGARPATSSSRWPALCREHDLVAVTDEVYEHLVFDGEHVPLATLPGMAERTLSDLARRQDVLAAPAGRSAG